jgi:SAM-dependent methyltransferase
MMLVNNSNNPSMKAIIENVASTFDVIPDIHELDFIFQYSLSRNTNVSTVVKRYFDRGAYAAKKLATFIDDKQNLSVLDFASGYGCVARHLRHFVPQASKVTCCDIHLDAVSFIRDRLGIDAFLSHAVPEQLTTVEKYDVIFALSFFSHLPESTWSRWLRKLLSLLSENGILVFTTHGYESLRRARYPINKFTGFKFSPASEQKDLAGTEYGNTIVQASYVVQQIPPGFRLIQFHEADWEGYQDVYVLTRTWV